ncbi:MAG TPA: hypothetical protein VLM79_31465 [Kofleriaceae bacterium]|nr:hypothetical protein [Kofleriaceae bacterium]
MQDKITHGRRTMLVLLLACLAGIAGCSTGAIDNGADSRDPAITSLDDLRGLAERYLFADTDAEGANAIMTEIRALSPSDAQRFTRHVRDLYPSQYTDGKLSALSDAFDELANEHGVNRFALSHDVQDLLTEAAFRTQQSRRDAASDLSANSCAWYETSCNWTSVWSLKLTGALCGGTCNQSNGIWNDQIGNAPCEKGPGCDYRIGYSLDHKPTHVGARSPAASCLVTYYSPNIIAHQFSSTAYALFGVGGVAYCLIPGGSYIQSYTYVY